MASLLERAVPEAIKLLDDENPCGLFYNMELFRSRCASIMSAFPGLNAIAMKSNPLEYTLRAAKAQGMGVEVASPVELEYALQLGFKPKNIVFDSPAKTVRDLERALSCGVRLNADNFAELDRIDAILKKFPSKSIIGVRINPQLGEGKIAVTGVVAPTSKFGLCARENHEALLQYYKDHPWLTAIHVHTGSQGCPLSLLVDSCRFIVRLREEIHARTGRAQVVAIDIGGGLPANYLTDSDGDMHITPRQYAEALRRETPALFGDDVELVTEFGRHISAKAGVFVSRVEYTKSAGGRRLAVQHVGADYMLRTCYQPKIWKHRVTAWSSSGTPLGTEDTATFDVVGPLCFRGDIIAHEIQLPRQLRAGDHVVVHDAGSYTLAMFSKYNSRQMCACFAFDNDPRDTPSLIFTRITAQQSVDEVVRSWRMPRTAKL